MQQKDLVEMLGREETMEMFLNGFARQVRPLYLSVSPLIQVEYRHSGRRY